MCERPGVRAVEFAGVGHAPALMSRGQIAVIEEFLLAPDASLEPTPMATA
jgi:hypothetical protein